MATTFITSKSITLNIAYALILFQLLVDDVHLLRVFGSFQMDLSFVPSWVCHFLKNKA